MIFSLIEEKKPSPRSGGRTHLKKLKKLIELADVEQLAHTTAVRTVQLPEPLAQYLIESISQLGEGKEPTQAFALSKKVGMPRKDRRNLLIALAIVDLQSQGMAIGKAIDYAVDVLPLSKEGVRSAYKKGKNLAGLVQSLIGQRGLDPSRREQSYIDIIQREYPAPVALAKAKQTHT